MAAGLPCGGKEEEKVMQVDLRDQLIRQFPADVLEITENVGGGPKETTYYACPTCKRAVSIGTKQCTGCMQVLNWDRIQQQERANGVKKAALEFEVPVDFVKGDCRKCPLSYIGKQDSQNVYECPLNLRTNCPLDVR